MYGCGYYGLFANGNGMSFGELTDLYLYFKVIVVTGYIFKKYLFAVYLNGKSVGKNDVMTELNGVSDSLGHFEVEAAVCEAVYLFALNCAAIVKRALGRSFCYVVGFAAVIDAVEHFCEVIFSYIGGVVVLTILTNIVFVKNTSRVFVDYTTEFAYYLMSLVAVCYVRDFAVVIEILLGVLESADVADSALLTGCFAALMSGASFAANGTCAVFCVPNVRPLLSSMLPFSILMASLHSEAFLVSSLVPFFQRTISTFALYITWSFASTLKIPSAGASNTSADA